MAELRLNPDALYVALDRRRRRQRLSWRAVAGEAGVSSATLSRISGGRRPDADTLVRLLAWLGSTDLTPYVTTEDGDTAEARRIRPGPRARREDHLMTDEIRVVLLKPGDVLLIGNVASCLPEDVERLHEAMRRLLGIEVLVFEDDIAIDRLSAEDLARRTGAPWAEHNLQKGQK